VGSGAVSLGRACCSHLEGGQQSPQIAVMDIGHHFVNLDSISLGDENLPEQTRISILELL
jgi:hypothetical protein